MKSTLFFTVCLLTVIFVLIIPSCNVNVEIDYTSMHVYKSEELQKIIDHAVKIETVGEPTVSKTAGDSSVVMTTTQVYKVFIAVGDDGHIIENADSIVALKRATGPIIITTSCNMVCTPVRPGEQCNVSGCEGTKKCGCSQGSCGNNCTTDTACHEAKSGFGFGRVIIF